MKTCRKCGLEKSLEGFNLCRNGSQGRYSLCKPCQYDYQRARKVADPSIRVREAETARVRWSAGYRFRRLGVIYGMDPGDLRSFVESRSDRCDICGEVAEAGLVIDHDHRSGEVRGAVCCHCNRMLGAARDNPLFLLSAVSYLEGERVH